MIKILLNLLFVLVLVLPERSFSQHFILSEFFAYQKEGVVKLQWTIKEGQTCNDIDIERAGQSLNYQEVGVISGICGSPDQSVTYTFTDSIPLKNQVNYYRLELGSQGHSTAATVETRFYRGNSYILKSNPGYDHVTLLFNNEDSKRYIFRIFDSRGNFIKKYITTQNKLNLPVNQMAAGVYIFQAVTETGTAFTGKFSAL